MADIQIKCVDCPTEFTFTDGEQRFYAEHNYAQPKRCKSCRAVKKARNSNQPVQQGRSDVSDARGAGAGHPAPRSTQWINADSDGGRRNRRRDGRDRDRRRDRFDD